MTTGAAVFDIATGTRIEHDPRDTAVRCYTVTTLATLWECGKTFLYEEIRAGRLNTVNFGRASRDKIRIRATDAIAWLEEQQH